ncbi:ATP10B [Cordylochernes scorpioides]|uniref:ATP10B n=1 Tax=Cordylochernes scorpioides TaxID=51811 RepID=A0ABY6L4A9_9ARAC|nr:ATP10B [Cordylochernes scorpioides]
MALCNTVVVSHYPHKDQMNASGFMMDQVGNGFLDSSSGSGSLLRPPLDPEVHSQNSSLSIPSTPTSGPRPIYEAESPDEIALVEAAYCYNFHLVERTPFSASILVPVQSTPCLTVSRVAGSGRVDYQLLCILPFDAVRKRMSVVVEDPLTGRKFLLAKGADSAIYPILAQPDTEGRLVQELEDEEFDDWLRNHRRIEAAVGLDEEEREQLLQASFSVIECELELLGASGIEDRLQDGVCDTISALRAANIVVWVLTGDKQVSQLGITKETAVNVALSCQLFTQEMELLTINARSKVKQSMPGQSQQYLPVQNTAAELLQFYLDELRHQSCHVKRALVIDGKTLMYLLDMEEEFVVLLRASSAVLCCRTTPLQKNLTNHDSMVCGPGDGANDVSMLQTADIGIGISGQEGLQAVMASDFALTRFCHLKKLLLVHGHWNYDRLTSVILYFFYKNSSVIYTIFWFQIFCGFSGAVMIDQLYLMLINVFFTSLPPIALGVLDQDCSGGLLLTQPPLYTQGQGSKVSLSFSFSLQTWLHVAAVALSLASYLGVVFLYNAYCVGTTILQNPYMVAQHLFPQPAFWFCLLLASLLACLPR